MIHIAGVDWLTEDLLSHHRKVPGITGGGWHTPPAPKWTDWKTRHQLIPMTMDFDSNFHFDQKSRYELRDPQEVPERKLLQQLMAPTYFCGCQNLTCFHQVTSYYLDAN